MSNLDPNVRNEILEWINGGHVKYITSNRDETTEIDRYIGSSTSVFAPDRKGCHLHADNKDSVYLVTQVLTGPYNPDGMLLTNLDGSQFKFRSREGDLPGTTTFKEEVSPGFYVFEIRVSPEQLSYPESYKPIFDIVSIIDDKETSNMGSGFLSFVPTVDTLRDELAKRIKDNPPEGMDLNAETTDVAPFVSVQGLNKFTYRTYEILENSLDIRPGGNDLGVIYFQLTNGDGIGVTGISNDLSVRLGSHLVADCTVSEILPSVYVVEILSNDVYPVTNPITLEVLLNESMINEATVLTDTMTLSRWTTINDLPDNLKTTAYNKHGFPFAKENHLREEYVQGETKIGTVLYARASRMDTTGSYDPSFIKGDGSITGVQFFTDDPVPKVITGIDLDIRSNYLSNFLQAKYYGEDENGIHFFEIAVPDGFTHPDNFTAMLFYDNPIIYNDSGVSYLVDEYVDKALAISQTGLRNGNWSLDYDPDPIGGRDTKIDLFRDHIRPDGVTEGYGIFSINKRHSTHLYQKWPKDTELIFGDPNDDTHEPLGKITPLTGEHFGINIDGYDYANQFGFKYTSEVEGLDKFSIGIHDHLRNVTYWSQREAYIQYDLEAPTYETSALDDFFFYGEDTIEEVRQRLLAGEISEINLELTDTVTSGEIALAEECYILPAVPGGKASITADGKSSMYAVVQAVSDSDSSKVVTGAGYSIGYEIYRGHTGIFNYIGELIPGVYVYGIRSFNDTDNEGFRITFGGRNRTPYVRLEYLPYNITETPTQEEAEYIKSSLLSKESPFGGDALTVVDYNNGVSGVELGDFQVHYFLSEPKLGHLYAKPDGEDAFYVAVQAVTSDIYPSIVSGVKPLYPNIDNNNPSIKVVYLGEFDNHVHVFRYQAFEPIYHDPKFTFDGSFIMSNTGKLEFTDDPHGPPSNVLMKWSYQTPFPLPEDLGLAQAEVLIDPIKTGSINPGVIRLDFDRPDRLKSGYIFKVVSIDGEELKGSYERLEFGMFGDAPEDSQVYELFMGSKSEVPGEDVVRVVYIDPISRKDIPVSLPFTVTYTTDGIEPPIIQLQLEEPDVADFAFLSPDGTITPISDGYDLDLSNETSVKILGFFGYFVNEDDEEPTELEGFLPTLVSSIQDGHGSTADIKYLGKYEEGGHLWEATPSYIGDVEITTLNKFGAVIGDGRPIYINVIGDNTDIISVRTWIDRPTIPTRDVDEIDPNDISSFKDFPKFYFSVTNKITGRPYYGVSDIYLDVNNHYETLTVGEPGYEGDGVYSVPLIGGSADGIYTIDLSFRLGFSQYPVDLNEIAYINVHDESKDGAIKDIPHDFNDEHTVIDASKTTISANGYEETIITVKLSSKDGGTYDPMPFSNDVVLTTNGVDVIGDVKFHNESQPGTYQFTIVSEKEGKDTFYVKTPSGISSKSIEITYGKDNRPPLNCEVNDDEVKVIDKKKSTIKVIPSNDPDKIYYNGFYYLFEKLNNGPYRAGPMTLRSSSAEMTRSLVPPRAMRESVQNDVTIRVLDRMGIDYILFEIELFEDNTGERLTGQNIYLMQKDNTSVGGYQSKPVEVRPGVYRVAIAASHPANVGSWEISHSTIFGGWYNVTFANDFSKGEASIDYYYTPNARFRPFPHYSELEVTNILQQKFNTDSVVYYNRNPRDMGYGGGDPDIPLDELPLDPDGDPIDINPVSSDGLLHKGIVVVSPLEGLEFPTDPDGPVTDLPGDYPPLSRVGEEPPPKPEEIEAHSFKDAKLVVVEGDPTGVIIRRIENLEDYGFAFIISGVKPGKYTVVFEVNGVTAKDTYSFKVYGESRPIVDILASDLFPEYENFYGDLNSDTRQLRIDPFTSGYSVTPVEADVGFKVNLDVSLKSLSLFNVAISKDDLYYTPVTFVYDDPFLAKTKNYCIESKYIGEVEPGVYRYEFSSNRPIVTPVRMFVGYDNNSERNGDISSMGYAHLVFRKPPLLYDIDPDISTIVTDRYEILADGEDTAIIDVTLYYVKASPDEKPRLAEGIKDVILVSKDGEILGRQVPIGEVEPGVYRFKLTSTHIGSEELTFMTHGEGAGEK